MMPEQVQAEPETLERLQFFVEGIPRPQGSKRAIGRGRMVEQSKYLPGWRREVSRVAEAAAAGRVFMGPVALLLDFYILRGKTVKRRQPTVPPDLDKLARAIADGITTAGVWGDDAQVVVLHARKEYVGDTPGVDVTIRELA